LVFKFASSPIILLHLCYILSNFLQHTSTHFGFSCLIFEFSIFVRRIYLSGRNYLWIWLFALNSKSLIYPSTESSRLLFCCDCSIILMLARIHMPLNCSRVSVMRMKWAFVRQLFLLYRNNCLETGIIFHLLWWP
jgi:hypothetical protein